ncbi:MAG: hypothetical protein ACK4PG_10725 [Acetobacteraceae bacterium]
MRAALLALALLAPGVALAQPEVQRQRQEARQADELAARDPAELLREAGVAVQFGRIGLANELLERAATELLTRSTIAGTEGTPVQGGAVGRIAAARAALARNDRVAARAEIERAIEALRRR